MVEPNSFEDTMLYGDRFFHITKDVEVIISEGAEFTVFGGTINLPGYGIDSDGSEIKAYTWKSPDSFIDLTDGKLSVPRVGYVLYENEALGQITRWKLGGAVDISEVGDPSEVTLRRAPGRAMGHKIAHTTLSVSIPDVTVATQASVVDLWPTDTLVWPSSGKFFIQDNSTTGVAEFSYTGINRATGLLTGLTLIRQSQTAFNSGSSVTLQLQNNATLGLIYAQSWRKKGGFQDRPAAIHFTAAEDLGPDGFGGDRAGGKITLQTGSPNGASVRRDQLVVMPTGFIGAIGSWMISDTDIDRRFAVAAKSTKVRTGFTFPVTEIAVEDPSGFPAAGSLVIASDAGDQTVAYTGTTFTAGVHKFTGVTGGAGTVSTGVNVQLAKETAGVTGVLGVKGGLLVNDWAAAATVFLGMVGPTAGASKEGGIAVGNPGGATISLYRVGASEWGIGNTQMRAIRSAGNAGFMVQLTGDTNARSELHSNGLRNGPGNAAVDLAIVRVDANGYAVRNAGDSADRDLRLRNLAHTGTTLGLFNTAATTKQTINGSRGGNAALADLLTKLALYGLLTDSTTA
jgi:hypothetical protein